MTSKGKMKTYRMNAVMAGALYFLGTAIGVTGRLVGGELLTSIGSGKPLAGVDMLGLIAANSSQLTTWGAFSGLMMGISLTAMTVFLELAQNGGGDSLHTGTFMSISSSN